MNESEDAFGRALLDWVEGRGGSHVVIDNSPLSGGNPATRLPVVDKAQRGRALSSGRVRQERSLRQREHR